MCSFTIPTYAADGTGPIDTTNMQFSAEILTDSDGDGSYAFEDCTDSIVTKIYNNSSIFDGMYSYRFPSTLSDKNILLLLSEPFSISADHEYTLSFDFGFSAITGSVTAYALLKYYNSSGEVLKEQTIDAIIESSPGEIHSFNIDFKPDVSDLEGGYKCKLELGFHQLSAPTSSEVIFVSSEINLIDKDDDTGWFQKIINKIEETINNIKQIPERINAKLTELKESITNAFVELKENLIEGLKGLFVPSDGFFEEKKAELELFLEEHFGILWTAPNIIISTIEQLLTMSPEEPSITMPAIQFTWEDELITLTEPMTVHFNDYIGEGSPLETFYNFYRVFVTIVLIFLFLNYCMKKYHYIFGKDGEAVEY